MRRASLALTCSLTTLVVALTACSEGGERERADRDEGPSLPICGALDAAEVEKLVGEPVTIEEKRFLGAGNCSVTGEEDLPILAIISESREASLDEIVTELTSSSEDHSTEPLEIEGTVEAVELEDTMSGISSRSLIATVEGGWYAITPFVGATREDERRVMVAAMTMLVGGDLPADAVFTPVDVPHPCDLLGDAAVAEALGQAVVSERNDGVEGLRQCLFRTSPEDTFSYLSVSDFADRPSLDAARSLDERSGTVEDVTAPGLLEAFIGVRDDDPSRVTAWAATQDATYQVTPDEESEDGVAEARAILELLGAASVALR
ncbi:hypothetical protein [Nocardioides psychrotolerans]|uniref:hypothetical protein n=1 Tax=Nocardioides psychrotolerans TaxID=1005945 RepID=UPI003137FA33